MFLKDGRVFIILVADNGYIVVLYSSLFCICFIFSIINLLNMQERKLELNNKENKYRSLFLLLIRFPRKWLWNGVWLGGSLLVNDLGINDYGSGELDREGGWAMMYMWTRISGELMGSSRTKDLPQLSCTVLDWNALVFGHCL